MHTAAVLQVIRPSRWNFHPTLLTATHSVKSSHPWKPRPPVDRTTPPQKVGRALSHLLLLKETSECLAKSLAKSEHRFKWFRRGK
mgnify:CR=1 FL=1